MKLAAFLIALFWAVPAFADTEYSCLKSCVAEGESHALCLSKCSYNLPEKSTPTVPATNLVCVKSCADDGSPASVCLPKCTMMQTPKPETSTDKNFQAKAHNALEAPTPIEGLLLNPPTRKKLLPVKSLDTSCMTFCRRGNMQTPYCTERCVKPDQ